MATPTTTTTTTRPSAFSQPTLTLGGFQGVASRNTEKSLRIFNGRTRYNEWVFLAGQQRIVGRPASVPGGLAAPLGPGRPAFPGGVPPGGGMPGGGVGIPPNLAPPPPPP
jgi:hypothetical protein